MDGAIKRPACPFAETSGPSGPLPWPVREHAQRGAAALPPGSLLLHSPCEEGAGRPLGPCSRLHGAEPLPLPRPGHPLWQRTGAVDCASKQKAPSPGGLCPGQGRPALQGVGGRRERPALPVTPIHHRQESCPPDFLHTLRPLASAQPGLGTAEPHNPQAAPPDPAYRGTARLLQETPRSSCWGAQALGARPGPASVPGAPRPPSASLGPAALGRRKPLSAGDSAAGRGGSGAEGSSTRAPRTGVPAPPAASGRAPGRLQLGGGCLSTLQSPRHVLLCALPIDASLSPPFGNLNTFGRSRTRGRGGFPAGASAPPPPPCRPPGRPCAGGETEAPPRPGGHSQGLGTPGACSQDWPSADTPLIRAAAEGGPGAL